MSRLILALITALLLIPVAATAQIYKSVDNEGNTVYSDTPPTKGGAEKLELAPLNTTPAPDPALRQPSEKSSEKKKIEYQLSITAPGNGITIPMGPGNFSVSANATPPLPPGARLQLKLNGNNWGEPQTSGSWALSNVSRGEQQLTVSAVDKNGDILGASSPTTVYVQRPSR